MSTALLRPFNNLLRVMFLRGSPERFLYSRKQTIAALVGALLLSGLAQTYYFGDHLVFMILRVFAETTMFMLWMVLMTAKVARLRLANMMLVLLLVSLFSDAVLLLIGQLLSSAQLMGGNADVLAMLWGGVVLYGAGNVVSWALRSKLWYGCVQVFLYLAITFALDQSFRWLYEIVAA